MCPDSASVTLDKNKGKVLSGEFNVCDLEIRRLEVVVFDGGCNERQVRDLAIANNDRKHTIKQSRCLRESSNNTYSYDISGWISKLVSGLFSMVARHLNSATASSSSANARPSGYAGVNAVVVKIPSGDAVSHGTVGTTRRESHEH
jgi:hypothetical protein